MKRGRRRTLRWGDGGGKYPLASGKAGFHLTCDLFNELKKGGSSERKRVSEYLEESPFWLARPSSRSLGMFQDGRVSSRRGSRGRRRTSLTVAESSQVSGVTRKTRMSGSSERARQSLERQRKRMACWLARSFPGQSLVTFFDERHSPVRRRQTKISQVFGRFQTGRPGFAQLVVKTRFFQKDMLVL
jgi:hypothetical protein